MKKHLLLAKSNSSLAQTARKSLATKAFKKCLKSTESLVQRVSKKALADLFEDFNVLKEELNFDIVDIRVHID